MIEVWLMSKDKKEKLRLPVPPSEFGPDSGVDMATINIHEVGEVGLIGKRRLNLYSIESYFPAKADALCQYTPIPQPNTCVKQINGWMNSGEPIRLIISGGKLSVNTLAAITDFSPRVRAGPADIWFTLTLQQYRTIKPVKARPKSGTYTVKKGDTITSIAKKVYGSTSKWKQLAKKNKLSTKKPPKLRVGQKLKY